MDKNIMTDSKLYPCVCCGKKTLHEMPPGTHEICPICGWEDDRSQYKDMDYRGGANACSLREARLEVHRKIHSEKAHKKHNQ